MSQSVSRLIKVLAFLTLVALLDHMLDATRARSNNFNALVDSISLSFGIESRYVDFVLVAVLAFGILWTLLNLSRSLAGMMKR